MQTEPPPSATFSETVNQWVIYDSYVDYEYQKELQDEQELKKRSYDPKVAKKRLLGDDNSDADARELSDNVVKAARVLERMVNQNIHIDVALGIILKLWLLVNSFHGLEKWYETLCSIRKYTFLIF